MEREEPKTGIAYLRARFRKRFRCLPARCLVRNPPRSQRLECAVERMRARRPRIEALQPTQRRFSCGLQFITMLHGMDWKLSQIAINAHLAHYPREGGVVIAITWLIAGADSLPVKQSMSTDVSRTITWASRHESIVLLIAAPGESPSTRRRLPAGDGRGLPRSWYRRSSDVSGFRFR